MLSSCCCFHVPLFKPWEPHCIPICCGYTSGLQHSHTTGYWSSPSPCFHHDLDCLRRLHHLPLQKNRMSMTILQEINFQCGGLTLCYITSIETLVHPGVVSFLTQILDYVAWFCLYVVLHPLRKLIMTPNTCGLSRILPSLEPAHKVSRIRASFLLAESCSKKWRNYVYII